MRRGAQWCQEWMIWAAHRSNRRISLVLGMSFLLLSSLLWHSHSNSDTGPPITTATTKWSASTLSSYLSVSHSSSLTGAFARFPTLSALPESNRRMTAVAVWNGDGFPLVLRHFFYTVQLNADSLDLLFINRKRGKDGKCLDLDARGLNVTWGGNVAVHCIDDKEWNRRHVDYMCSEEYGWNCDSSEYDKVMEEYQKRENKRNYTWRPFLGWAFRDLMPRPETPFWAWIDADMFLGNFARYPFNILSQLSLVTGTPVMDHEIFLAGQLTAFNMDDKVLGGAWRKIPEMRSVAHFTKYLDGKMPEASEERYWSYEYMGPFDDRPGADLSYAILPDIMGDDYYNGSYDTTDSDQVYIVSGRDVLMTSKAYSREHIEDLLKLERADPIDDLGGVGWTGGEDGSAYLIEQPDLDSSEAKRLAVAKSKSFYKTPAVHDGLVEDVLILPNCTEKPSFFRHCVDSNPLVVADPPIMRATLVRFKEQQPGHLLRRLEWDQRRRGYERKLFKHNLRSKKLKWLKFPRFDITEDLVLRTNMNFMEVWKMGPDRNKTLFWRREGEKSIG